MTCLHIQSLSKSWGAVRAVDAVDLELAAGGRAAIVGPSGSGKTTLLRMIAGFETPDSGSIRLDGTTLAEGGKAVPAHLRRIGYVPQDGALFPHLSVADNIGFGLSGERRERQRRIDELLAMVSLEPAMLKRWPHELSGGQQQRVALARAMAQQPRLMLLDEPFSALDTGLRASLRKAVAEVLREAGIASILVTHDQAEALSFATQLAVMRQGRLVQAGSPEQLYRHPVDADTALFLGEAVLLPATVRQGKASCRLGELSLHQRREDGPTSIMLRPDQLRLSAAGDGHPASGLVLDSDFGGQDCLITIQLPDSPAGQHPGVTLQVRSPSLTAPRVGSRVAVEVCGSAHALAG
ncbi:ABC transporter ATP-binding protein [uncultured Aquitalea sp.]|uniref:ABC transporter ATP-binding protein n=1 Tax=uncultured Aquitalea sp. TaxID=540272 RepID=UPI0025CD18EC|nr:ABC transporter ATP-binding protein [uncultured Aquitalea sp.]